ncbi:MAG: hypothetical protein ACJ0E6_04565 [Gammaproteobacteria bacterium]|jgi:hypothetical protein
MINEPMLWDAYWNGAGAIGPWFFGIAFLAWVGLRISNGIYNSADANLVVKIAGTAFCLSVAWFGLINAAWFEWHSNGVAGVFAWLAENSEAGITPGAAAFVEANDPGAGFSIAPNLPQGVFWGSLLLIQLGQIWTKK